MPFVDRTGPWGLRPGTGRAMSYCSGFAGPGTMNPASGISWFGFSRGRCFGWFGRGRGWRHWYQATGLPNWTRAGYDYPFGVYPYTPTAKEEMDSLKDQAEFLKQQLGEIESRISTLEKAQAQESG